MMKWVAYPVIASILAFGSSWAFAETSTNYPNHEIKIVVPYSAGSSDIYVRQLEEAVRRDLNQPIVVINQSGAGGTIGTNVVKRSEPDGYTVLFGATSLLTIAPHLIKTDYQVRDFVPVVQLVSSPQLIAVRKDSQFKTLQQLIDYAKSHPGNVTYGTNGVGGATHLFMEALQEASGTQLTHVPFTGGSQATTAVLGGHIDAVIAPPGNIEPQAGALRVLAVTSKERFKLVPDVPTVRESGYDIELVANFGLLVPKGTPKPIVDKLFEAFGKAARDSSYQDAMAKLYVEVAVLGPDEFMTGIISDEKIFGGLIAKMQSQNSEKK